MKKLYTIIGVLIVLNLICLGALFSQKKSPFGGTTNLDSLSLGSNLSVTGTSTLTGATTQTGAITIAGAIDANGALDVDGATTLDATTVDEGLILGGTVSYANTASRTLTASDIFTHTTILVDGDNTHDSGCSLSFPNDETINASYPNALYHRFTIVNSDTSGSVNLDLVTTGMDYSISSGTPTVLGYDNAVIVDLISQDGTSWSWTFQEIDTGN